ncbi:unnamed protein product [Symbiodinium sp. CCMP2592]|nr:unnamed protein product [Symbiodinium sp. CCMP2592]
MNWHFARGPSDRGIQAIPASTPMAQPMMVREWWNHSGFFGMSATILTKGKQEDVDGEVKTDMIALVGNYRYYDLLDYLFVICGLVWTAIEKWLLQAHQEAQGVPMDRGHGRPFLAEPNSKQKPLEALSSYSRLPPPHYEIRPGEDDAIGPPAIHISCWVATVHYEPEMVDIAVPFPLTEERLRTLALEDTSHFPKWHPVLTWPQLSSDYASAVLVPPWILLSGRYVMVADLTGIGGGAYTFYFEAMVSKASMLREVNIAASEPYEVFIFGDLAPLTEGERRQPIQGGVVKILPRGIAVDWATDLAPRLTDPGQWRPDTDPPRPAHGTFLAYQDTEHQIVNMVLRRDPRSTRQIAGDTLGHEPEDIWVDVGGHPRSYSTIVFVDLRGVGKWVQWLAVEGNTFDPMPYLDSLHLPYFDNWSIVVRGGRKTGNGIELEVQNGELLTIDLRHNNDITPTASEDGDSDGPDEESDSDPDSPDDEMRDDPSDVEPDAEPDAGMDNRPDVGAQDRSRSPRRPGSGDSSLQGSRHKTKQWQQKAALPLLLASCLPPANFDLTRESLPLPHDKEEVMALMRPWRPDWILQDMEGVVLHKDTQKALQDMEHWSDFLLKVTDPIEAHIYTDGSYLQKEESAAYGAVIRLEAGGASTLFGLFGEPLPEVQDSLWHFEAPPVLRSEQVAVASALLWLCQSRMLIRLVGATLHFDNMAAGWSTGGQWEPPNSFGRKARELAMFVNTLFQQGLTFRHVSAHQGDPWNELADAVAKAMAMKRIRSKGPPLPALQAFIEGDFSWLTLATWGINDPSFPTQTGSHLTWTMPTPTSSSPLTPQQLVPTKSTWPGDTDRQWDFHCKVATINVQGIAGKHAYLEEQFEEAGYHIVFLQETKEKGGMCRSSRYLRFGSDGCGHWGTSIWVSRTLGLLDAGGKACHITDEDVETLHSTERLLALSVRQATFRCILLSCHCPHTGRPEEREHYLERLGNMLEDYREATLVLMGIDLNGRPPPNFGAVTGGLTCGEVDATGTQAAKVFEKGRLWMPSTYTQYHTGPSVTFCHPSGQKHRIDFVCLGGKAASTGAHSCINHHLDVATSHDDHFVVQLECYGSTGPLGSQGRLWRPRYDRGKMRSAAGKELLHHEISKYAPPPWSLHVDAHCQHLQDFLHRTMQEHFALPLGGPRATYIPEWVWKLRRKKLAYKAQVAHRKRVRREWVQEAFAHWSGRTPQKIGDIGKDDLLYQLAAAAIGCVTKVIKNGIREAKAEYLQRLADEGGTATKILQKAKQAGVGGRKARPVVRPPPLLLDKEGRPVVSQEAREELWLNHFGEMEVGTTAEVADFLAGLAAPSEIPGRSRTYHPWRKLNPSFGRPRWIELQDWMECLVRS